MVKVGIVGVRFGGAHLKLKAWSGAVVVAAMVAIAASELSAVECVRAGNIADNNSTSADCCAAQCGWMPMGELGQSGTEDGEPVPMLSVRVVADDAGNVVFENKWFAGPGDTRARKLSSTVAGTIMGDGRNLYAVSLWGTTVRKTAFSGGGLRYDGAPMKVFDAKGAAANFAIAPAGCEKGFCAKAKFAVLDRKGMKVRGYSADGGDAGVLLDYSGHEKAKLVESVGFLAETGDLLLGTGYPEDNTRRFAPDGREVLGPLWPSKARGRFCVADGRTWAVSSEAVELSASEGCGRRIGFKAFGVNSIAASGGRFWLGTAQGALLFDPRHPQECLARVGGTGEVDALAMADGRVFAFVGPRICQYWLDDRPDEPLSSDDVNWMWRIGGNFYSGKVVAAEKHDDAIYLDFANGGKRTCYAFAWWQSLWMKRAERMRKAEGFAVRPPKRPDDMPEGDFTAFALEGDWLVAYSPSRMAICKFKRRGAK